MGKSTVAGSPPWLLAMLTLPLPPAHTPAVADAAQNNDVAAVKKLIAQGADVNIAEGDGAETGHAWTAAYVFTPNEHWRFTLEWLRVTSSSYYRNDVFGLASLASETQVQLAVRYALGSALR